MSLHPRLAVAALSRPVEFSLGDLYEHVWQQDNLEAGDLLPELAAARCRPRELSTEDRYWVTESMQHAYATLAVLLWRTSYPLAAVAARCCLPGERVVEHLDRVRDDWSWMRAGEQWQPALDALDKTWVEADTIPGERVHLVFADSAGRQAHLALVRNGDDEWPWLLDVAACR